VEDLSYTSRRSGPSVTLTGIDLLQGKQMATDWPMRRLPMFLESSLSENSRPATSGPGQ
jgi:hypothetical protein